MYPQGPIKLILCHLIGLFLMLQLSALESGQITKSAQHVHIRFEQTSQELPDWISQDNLFSEQFLLQRGSWIGSTGWPANALYSPEGYLWPIRIDHTFWRSAFLADVISQLSPISVTKSEQGNDWAGHARGHVSFLQPIDQRPLRFHQTANRVAVVSVGFLGKEFFEISSLTRKSLHRYWQAWQQQVLNDEDDFGMVWGPILKQMNGTVTFSLHSGPLFPSLRFSFPRNERTDALARSLPIILERAAPGWKKLLDTRQTQDYWIISLGESIPSTFPEELVGVPDQPGHLVFYQGQPKEIWKNLRFLLNLSVVFFRDQEQLNRLIWLTKQLENDAVDNQTVAFNSNHRISIEGFMTNPLERGLLSAYYLLTFPISEFMSSQAIARHRCMQWLNQPTQLVSFDMQEGYRYALYHNLADKPSQWTDGAVEGEWVLYAWPQIFGADGRQTFAVSSSGLMYSKVKPQAPASWYALWLHRDNFGSKPRWHLVPQLSLHSKGQ